MSRSEMSYSVSLFCEVNPYPYLGVSIDAFVSGFSDFRKQLHIERGEQRALSRTTSRAHLTLTQIEGFTQSGRKV